MFKLRFRLVIALISLLSTACSARETSVLDFGAVGDGKTDCTAAFQKALDSTGSSGGGTVVVPTGRYRINGNLSVPGFVTLQGTYRTPPVAWNDPANLPGSVLLAYAGRGSNSGEPFIRLKGSAATVVGLIIDYPEWKQSQVPPVPYPPCIMSEITDNVAVIDCNILNAYEAIRFVRAGRHFIRNVQGYPIWRGIYVDECYDIGRIENVHFWPFGVNYKHDDPYCKWINVNSTAFHFDRTDWQYVTNTFCFGYGVGYRFSENKNGGCNGNFLGIGADSCRRAILVEQAQGPGLLITNGEFVGRWGSVDSVGLEMTSKVNGKVSLNNCSFWGPLDKCVLMNSPKGQFTASACNFMNWDINRTGVPALDLKAGRAIVQGNTFEDGQCHIGVGADVTSAIITGNQAKGGLTVLNKAGKRTVLSANEEPIVKWTREARANYILRIGSENDSKLLKNWHGAETGQEWSEDATKRWSAPSAQMILPVLPGKPYELTMAVYVPKQALEPGAGVYLGGKQILKFDKEGKLLLTGKLPAQKGDTVTLEVRCRSWLPMEVIPNNQDNRKLGVVGIYIKMKSRGASGKVFDGNNGQG